MTRLWRTGEPIVVDVGEGTAPIYFVWRGKQYPVETIHMRWHSDDGWWNDHVWREYFKLSTKTGQLVIVYRDLLTLNWFFQRLYD